MNEELLDQPLVEAAPAPLDYGAANQPPPVVEDGQHSQMGESVLYRDL